MVPFIMRIASLCAALGLVAAAPLAHADPTIVAKGEALLPTTGLLINLPALREGVYHVSGSWGLDDAMETYDARDVIDEISPDGSVAAGNWVLAGYFSAGDCDDVVADSPLEGGSNSEEKIWGEDWVVRAGVWKFRNELGRRPAAVLCRSSDTGPALVLYRFLTTSPETVGEAAILKDVRRASVLAAASDAFSKKRTRSFMPLTRTDVTSRGPTSASRTLTLETNGLRIETPADGFVWLASPDENSDLIDRVMPVFREATLEVVARADTTCGNLLSNLPQDGKQGQKAQNLPEGWIAGPSYADDTGPGANPVVCYDAKIGALLVLLMNEGAVDFTPYHPLLRALTNAERIS